MIGDATLFQRADMVEGRLERYPALSSTSGKRVPARDFPTIPLAVGPAGGRPKCWPATAAPGATSKFDEPLTAKCSESHR